MIGHTPTKIPFLPWANDNGLVCGTLPDGGPTFDIYDASNQPINGDLEGDDKSNHEIATAMTVAVNNHEALVEALTETAEALELWATAQLMPTESVSPHADAESKGVLDTLERAHAVLKGSRDRGVAHER